MEPDDDLGSILESLQEVIARKEEEFDRLRKVAKRIVESKHCQIPIDLRRDLSVLIYE